MRTYRDPAVLDSLLRLFASFDECDIYVSTWITCGVSYNHGHIIRIGNEHDRVTEEDIRTLYPRVQAVEVLDFQHWLTTLSATYRRIYEEGFYWNGMHIRGTAVPQLWALWNANRLRCESKRTYDCVMRVRPDAIFSMPIPKEILEDTEGIWAINCMATGTYYPQRIYDIFFFGSPRNMTATCDAYNHLESLIAHPFSNGLHPRDVCRLLYVQTTHMHGIRVKDLPLDVCVVKR
jgi:hypothetical protein